MSLLEPHVCRDQPRWTGALQLDYDSSLVWLKDLGLVRERLGWQFLAADDMTSRCWGYCAFTSDEDGIETSLHMLLPTNLGHDFPPNVRECFRSAQGRQAFLTKLNSIEKVPYTEPLRRWERLRELPAFEVGDE
jgi:hypothetical protein